MQAVNLVNTNTVNTNFRFIRTLFQFPSKPFQYKLYRLMRISDEYTFGGPLVYVLTRFYCILNRLSNLKKRAEQIPSFSQSLEACRSLRKERDNRTDLAEQLQAQRSSISHADVRRMKLSEELKTLQAHGDRLSGQTLLDMSADELRLKKSLATERLPREVTFALNYRITCQHLLVVITNFRHCKVILTKIHLCEAGFYTVDSA